MLVLSRKVGEKIYIAGGIEVVVMQVKGKQVRLGFIAPETVKIDREEKKPTKEG